MKLLLLAILAALLGGAIAREHAVTPASDPIARATDPMRPKVWDFPGHNDW